MTEPSKPFNRLDAIKHSEPLAVLASLSLVITAFVFPYKNQGLGAIYNHSIVSGFMFIISFVFALAHEYHKYSMPLRYQFLISNRFLEIGIYFFMGIGIIALLFVAYEFGKTQVQIFALVKTFFFSFTFGIIILGIVKKVRKTETETETDTKDTESQKLDTITILALATIVPVWFGLLFDSIMEVLYAHIKFGPVISAFEFNYVYPISPIILFVLLAIRTNNSRKKLISSKLKKRLWPSILLFLLIGFIAGAIYSIAAMLVQYLHLFGIISHMDLFKFFIQFGKFLIESIRHIISTK